MRYLAASLLITLALTGCQSAMDSKLVLPKCETNCTVVVIYKDTEALFERGGQAPSTTLAPTLRPSPIPGL